MASDILVVFDVGGVLAKLDFKIMFSYFSKKSGISIPDLQDAFAKSSIELSRNKGDEQAYFDGVRAILHRPELNDATINAVTQEAHPDAIHEMIALKQRLHDAGHTIGILSVISPSTRSFLDQHWPDLLETWGGPRELSYETGILKPDPRAYERFLHLGARRIIFIDDKKAYLKYPVEQLGWIGIHYTGNIDHNEPMRRHHQDEDVINGEWYDAATVKDVECNIRDAGLQF